MSAVPPNVNDVITWYQWSDGTLTCPACGASVHPGDATRHRDWHRALEDLLRPHTLVEKTVLTADELAELRAKVANGAGHECSEWWTSGGVCALCGRTKIGPTDG